MLLIFTSLLYLCSPVVGIKTKNAVDAGMSVMACIGEQVQLISSLVLKIKLCELIFPFPPLLFLSQITSSKIVRTAVPWLFAQSNSKVLRHHWRKPTGRTLSLHTNLCGQSALVSQVRHLRVGFAFLFFKTSSSSFLTIYSIPIFFLLFLIQ